MRLSSEFPNPTPPNIPCSCFLQKIPSSNRRRTPDEYSVPIHCTRQDPRQGKRIVARLEKHQFPERCQIFFHRRTIPHIAIFPICTRGRHTFPQGILSIRNRVSTVRKSAYRLPSIVEPIMSPQRPAHTDVTGYLR